MNKDIYASECVADEKLKHERVDQAIKRLGDVLCRLEGMRARISGEPWGCDPEKPTANCTLQSLLVTAPDQIHGFCDAAVSVIDNVEEKLF